jgi:hypothetical protein
MAHALTTDAGDGDLDAATVANHVLVLDALILTASALIIADRAENLLAKKTTRLGLEGAIIDGLGVLNLALGPGANRLWGRDGYGNAVERRGFEAESIASFFASACSNFVGLNAHSQL